MSVFVIPKIQNFDPVKAKTGTFLLIINADKKPPHIALLIHGKVFSLTVKGRQIGDPIAVFLKAVFRNSLKTLFIEINPSNNFNTEDIVKLLSKAIMEFERVEPGKITCLNPIKSFFNSVYHVNTGQINFVFDLIPQLYEMKLIKAVYHLNLSSELNGEDYFFEKYAMSDINNRIIELSN